jgi:pimeloyl-ACP methyl ester carboxylesterase
VNWGRRWLRRIARVILVGFAAVTVFSLVYNLATAGATPPPQGLKYVRTGDYQTRYESWGTTGTPIVLVHGFVESADTWSAVALLLAQGHRVFAYDVHGFGYTDRTGPYGTSADATQLLDFLAAMHLARPLLVGHSAGAAIIAAATLRDPGAVGGIVFLDGDALSTGVGQRSSLANVLVNPYRTTIFRLVIRSDWLIRKIYSAQCGPACPRLDAAGIQQWRRPFQVPGALDGLWAMTRAGGIGLPATEVARLAHIPMPKAVVFGAGDAVFGQDAGAQTAARIGAPPPTLIPGARHLSLISQPSQVARAIELIAGRIPG